MNSEPNYLANPYSLHVNERLNEEEVGSPHPPIGREGIRTSLSLLHAKALTIYPIRGPANTAV